MVDKLTPRQEKWFKKWEYWHNKNKWRYILSTGITWGILTAAFVTLIYRWYYQVCEQTNDLIIRFVIFILVGIPYGYILWRTNEKRYNKYLELKGGKKKN